MYILYQDYVDELDVLSLNLSRIHLFNWVDSCHVLDADDYNLYLLMGQPMFA